MDPRPLTSRRLDGRVCSESLAYVLFSSGASGKPQGVAVEHLSLLAMVGEVGGSLAPGAVVGNTASFALDTSVMLIWPALCTGAAVAMAEKAVLVSVVLFLRFVQRHQAAWC